MANFELPQAIDSLSTEELDALTKAAKAELAEIDLDGDVTDEDLSNAEALVDALAAITAQSEILATEAQARADRLAALRTATAETEVIEEVIEVEVEVAEAAAEVVSVEEVDVVETPQPVAASASTPIQRAVANAPEVIVPETKAPVSLIAAADVPGYPNGAELEGFAGVAKAVIARSKGLPRQNLATAAGGVRQRYGAAVLTKPFAGEGLVQTAQSDDYKMAWNAGDEKRLPGQSLVAAGVWCAPSETLYDLCQYETVEGILDIPAMTVTRGGIRWTEGPSFSSIYTACGFFQTEAQAIAGECKTCCSVDCPPFSELRMDAIGLCIKTPLLTEHAYPELTQRFVEGALVAHQHKVNKYIIDTMVLAAGDGGTLFDTGSTSKTILGLEYAAIGMRYQNRLALDATIEMVAPWWLNTAIRIDAEMRNSAVFGETVTDASINAWFAARNISVQWVYDYQDPTYTVNNCLVDIPAVAQVLIYPAGTWIKGEADVINIDSVYDSPNLEANQYTALFIEEGILAVQKCLSTCAIDIPLCASGKGVIETLDVCVIPAYIPV